MSNQSYEQDLGYTSQKLMSLFRQFSEARKPFERMWKLLDAYDRGIFWEMMKINLPNYSVKPDTNWINYVKTSITNSLYTGNYRGEVFPRSKNDKDITREINEFLEYTWDKLSISKYILRAGERTGLLNFGAIQVGWDSQVINGNKETSFVVGDLEVKFIDNMSLLLDPSVKVPHNGRAMFIVEYVSLVELRNNPRFKDRIDEYEKEMKSKEHTPSNTDHGVNITYYNQRDRQSEDETVKLITCFYKYQPEGSEGYRIDQVWLIENGYIIATQKDIKPKKFPIRILYATPPVADPYGIPITKLILNSCITLNVLDCIDATHIYASSKRPRAMDARSGINEQLFAREGNNPDKLWVTQGNPDNAIKYFDLPELPRDRNILRNNLEIGIMRVTGVDDRYTGRDTGSVQTTGGMNIMNQRISMSDNIRVSLLQEFIKELTELILSFYIEHGGKRDFPRRTKAGKLDSVVSIDFEELKSKDFEFDYTVNVTPHLPNNVMRRSEIANIIMEKQMQYQWNPQLMTPEEWIDTQDFPQKYQILERLKEERMQNDREELMSDMMNYAGLVQQGMRPESAVDQLAQERQLKRENPGLGNVAGAGSFQQKQS